MPQGGAVIGDFVPDNLQWLKRENASVFDSNLTKAVREIANRLGVMDPMTYLVGLLGTEIPSAGEMGGIAGAVSRLMERAGPKPLQRIANPIIAHHGSPHDFAPVNLIELADGTRLYQNLHELPTMPQGATLIEHYPMGRFDMSKIGTGEGAQAYGHGLYFAENPTTAKIYREQLSTPEVKVAGQVVDLPRWSADLPPDKKVYRRLFDKRSVLGPTIDDADVIREVGKDIQAAVENAQHFKDPAEIAHTSEQLRTFQELVSKGVTTKPGGRMYEVAIHADPESFLDWDKPLSQQPQAFNKLMNAYELGDDLSRRNIRELLETRTGASGYADFARTMAQRRFRGSAADIAGDEGLTAIASERLKQAGIPGIKYLDQGSRAAGQGTRNYVVFDDALIEIRKKWGVAIAAGVEEMLRHRANQQNGAVAADDLDAAIGLQTRRPREVGTIQSY